MKRRLYISFIALMFAGTATAQSYSGALVNVDCMTIGDMANISNTQFQFGTARSMAMAGALSSLGADVSTMATNPAGVGLFQRSELTITPILTISKSESSAQPYGSNTLTTPALGNFSFVVAIPFGNTDKGLMNINFGVGYNRLTDLNYRTSTHSSSMGRESSIGQFFSNQLNDYSLSPSDVTSIKNPNIWNNLNPSVWGAALGYQSGLADQVGGVWSPSWIADDATVGHYLNIESQGSVGEYDISLAANISNKLYIGMTLGLVQLKQEINNNYSEDYGYPSTPSNSHVLNFAHYNQTAILDGSGVNFKLGIIYRPVESLRLSLAVHTPTAYSINRDYQAAVASNVTENPSGQDTFYEEASAILEDYYENGWYFNTPTRVLLGASYTLGNRALLSIDYQRDWYNSMRVTAVPYGVYYDYDAQMDYYYKGTNTIRAGVEFRVTPNVALRGGYGHTSSMIERTDDIVESPASPVVNGTSYYSAGLGFNVSKHFVIDFAYMCYKSNYTDFKLYSTIDSPLYSLKSVSHNIAMTTSFKF